MKKPNIALVLSMFLSASAELGCAAKDANNDDRDGVPEQAALELRVSEDVDSEALATDADSIDPALAEVSESLGVSSEALASEVAPELAHCRDAVRHLNQALRNFMQPIVALVRETEPTSTNGDVRTWGPVVRGATEFRFSLRHGTARHYGWVLQARHEGSNAEFSNVAAGGITVGFQKRRGRGSVGIDLDALSAVDPTILARGTLLAGFAHGPTGSTLGYRLRGFTPDPANHAPLDALVHGIHLRDGYNRARLAYHGDVAGSASEAEELVLARVRHRRSVGGRADLLALGGDVADGRALVVSECWNVELKSGYRIVRDCPRDGLGGESCQVVTELGDASNCPDGMLAAELPPDDATAPMSDPESPESDVAPPETMPDGTPPSQ